MSSIRYFSPIFMEQFLCDRYKEFNENINILKGKIININLLEKKGEKERTDTTIISAASQSQ